MSSSLVDRDWEGNEGVAAPFRGEGGGRMSVVGAPPDLAFPDSKNWNIEPWSFLKLAISMA